MADSPVPIRRPWLAALLLGACVACDTADKGAPGAPPAEASRARTALHVIPASSARPSLAPAQSEAPPSALAEQRPRGLTPYAPGKVHSPLTAGIVGELGRLRRDHPELRDDLFIKIGDSISASADSLRCVGSKLDLAERRELGSVVNRFYLPGRGGIDPFARRSHAAGMGYSARTLSADAFALLSREQAELRARFALVELGTNDLEDRTPHAFADHMLDMVDWLLARGVLPVLFTPPPRRDRVDAALWAARYGAVVRAVAQARQVPLVDYQHALRELPRNGLGKDGIHPSTFSGERGRNACELSAGGLRHGYNLRNLLALQALGRLLDRVVDGALPPEPDPPPVAGVGSTANPFEVEQLPFVDVRTLHGVPAESTAPSAPGAAASANRGELCADRELRRHAFHYRLHLGARARVYALAFDRELEGDLVLIDASGSCVAHPRVIERELVAGTHELMLVPRTARARDAESMLVIGAEDPTLAAMERRARLAENRALH